MKHFLKSGLLHALAAATLVVMPMHQAQSAPGTLPTSPLYLSTIVEPNVFLTLDDSRSMSWEVNIRPGTGLNDSLTQVLDYQGVPVVPSSGPYANLRSFLHPAYGGALCNNTNVVPPAEIYPEAWILKSPAGNTTYYNPDVTYIPWPGTDATGTPLYEPYPITGPVPLFPNSPGALYLYSDYILTADFPYCDTIYDGLGNIIGKDTGIIYLPTYYTTTDSNGNGVVDIADDHTEVKITDPVELQNFANWFVYYRTREYATKATIGKIINNTDSNRMGLGLINSGLKFATATMTDPVNKLALLKAFYNSTSAGTTPLRTALDNVGQMFTGELASAVPAIASPILSSSEGGTCQQNFNILMTDGYWNGPIPTWGTKPPKDTKNTDVNSDTDPSIFDGDADQSNDNGNYADNYTNTLADVAMHYYETDLSTLADEVPAREGLDEATHQHLVNYTLSFGLEGSLDRSILPTNDAFAGWPDPLAAGENKIDDLWHASYNSRGRHVYADDSAELESQLSLTLSSITEASGTVTASVAVNSAKLSTSSTVYLASFYSDFWRGELAAYLIEDLNTGALRETPEWQAGPKLTARVRDYGFDRDNRPIITFDPVSRKGLPFMWSDITAAMQDDFNTSPGGALDALGQSRLDYIRGDRSNENIGNLIVGNGFRERSSLLGDIVNSSPVYVGPPNLAWPDFAPFPTGTNAYTEFKNAQADRKHILYVGANDGMLHAFTDDGNNDPDDGIANGGEELFAYVPGSLYSSGTSNRGLHYLTDPNYIHNFYVDLTPTVSDVFFSTGSWRTVLLGGLRGGGRGLFALDITDPDFLGAATDVTKADAISLWEFTSADDPDLGYTFSRPTIGLTNAGTWVAIFGNGYNPDPALSPSGEASLFIVNIERGLDGSWAQPGDYIKISTGVGTPGAQNGLGAPALADLDGNGTIDRAYAGDLEGNMWVFDLKDIASSRWGVAYGSSSTPGPLFTTPADLVTGKRQPITAKPVLASHPTQPKDGNNDPNLMVYFGTGQYLVDGDKVTKDLQSFYGVWDMGDDALLNINLVEQTFDLGFSERVLTRNAVDYSINYGWFFNLTDSGERAVTTAIARSDTVFFNTFVPSEEACDRGGYGYRFAVDMATGGSPLEPSIDNNNDGVVDDKDYVNNGITDGVMAAVRQEGFLPEPVFIEDLAFTGNIGSKIKSLSNVPKGRFSWQELLF